MSEYLLSDLPRYVKTAPRGNFANSVVKEGAVLLFSEDGETLVAKHPDGTFSEIGSGSSGGGNLEVGVLVDDGGTLKIQPLAFNGTAASEHGMQEAYTPKIFNTTQNEPAYQAGSGGISAEYYKCASVAEPGTLSVNIPNNAELSGVYTYNSSNGRYVNTNGAFFLHDGNYWVLVGTNGYYYCQSDEIASGTTPVDATGWKLSSGSMDAIDMTVTIPSTWSGYKAVFDSTAGTWSFESDVTEGLTYTSVTPIVGSIYSADALARIQSLYQGEPSGLIFRAPLASDLVDIVGGVQGESWGTAPVYGQIDGKDCVTTNGTGIKFTFDSAGLVEDIWSPRTIMLWFRKTDGSGWKQIYGPADSINIREVNSTVHYGKYEQESTVSISNNVWYHHAFTVTENNIKWYIDGVLKTSNTSWTPAGLLTYFSLATWSGTVGESPGGAWSGQIADVRIYNRVLDAAEIQQIYEA